MPRLEPGALPWDLMPCEWPGSIPLGRLSAVGSSYLFVDRCTLVWSFIAVSPTKRKGTEHWGFLFESGLAADWCGRVEKRRLYHKKKDKIQGAVKCRKEVDSHCSQASWLLVVSRVWRSGLVTLIGKQDETADDERRERASARAERAARHAWTADRR